MSHTDAARPPAPVLAGAGAVGSDQGVAAWTVRTYAVPDYLGEGTVQVGASTIGEAYLDAPPFPEVDGPVPTTRGRRASLDGVSVTALVAALLTLGPLALLLGLAGLVCTSRGLRRGRATAVAAVLVGLLGTAAWAAAVLALDLVPLP